MRLDLNSTIRASTDDLKIIFFEEWLNIRSVDKDSILGLARSRVEESNRILKMIINIFGINGYFHVVILLFKSSKGCENLYFFVRFQESFLRIKLNFIFIFIRNLPFIL